MTTRYTFSAYFISFFAIVVPVIMFFILYNINVVFHDNMLYAVFSTTVMFIIEFILYTTLRTKVITVSINETEISVKRFLGLGPEKKYRIKDLDGFHLSKVEIKRGHYDCIYIIYKNKKVAKVSNLYHDNYDYFLNRVEDYLKDLGYTESDFITELKDAFDF